MSQNCIITKLSNIGLANHPGLPGESGRLDDTPLNERICNICTTDDIGVEYQYLCTCDFFKSGRKLYLKSYFYVKPNIRKYMKLFTPNK